MISVKLEDIINSMPAFEAIAEQKIKGRLAYKIARLMRENEKEYNSFLETRIKIFEKYAKRGPNGEYLVDDNGNNYIEANSEGHKKFIEELKEVTDSIISINAEPLKVEDLEELDITTEQVKLLLEFVKE